MTHPITPPPELAQKWIDANRTWLRGIALEAAQWGADQELEECCEWLTNWDSCDGERLASLLREGRRPKPPSLKEQALKELAWVDKHLDMPLHNHCNAIHTIRRALEALPE